MTRMKEHSPSIVEQAKIVNQELIRVAILWHEGLEKASRLYFTEQNPEGMIAVLEPLHQMIEDGPTTAREKSFVQVFGKELHEAHDACRQYRRTGEISELNEAWDIYYAVFKNLEKQLPTMHDSF